MTPLTDHLPHRGLLKRGLAIAVTLWLCFLVLTAYTSAATLLERVGETDVMRAASGGAWSGRILLEIASFVLAVVVLHLFFAGLNWGLACATAVWSATARQKFGRTVVGWFCLLAAAALVYNALWYPRTLIGAWYHGALATQLGPVQLGQAVYGSIFALCSLAALRAAAVLVRSATPAVRRRSFLAGSAILAVVAVGALWPLVRPTTATASEGDRPHIIMLGIDSLRLEQLRRFGGTGATPNLDRFLARADLFTDTTTPAARTYSSWTAILTGRSPPTTGARFNLAERSSVRANPTIADVLRQTGYRTVYSTDEVRFANIDESYGFDQVVTPRIGASDFLIGTYNELPLSSMFINTRVGRWLFPFSYANRGVATMFQPETWLDRVRREVTFDEPTLLISHLTAAHWPYYVSDTPWDASKPASELDRPLYNAGLQTADEMFGELVEILEGKGALRNAIVIVLSDHGEALGLPSDSFFDNTFFVEGMRAPLKMYAMGHGQSVLSRSQYQVLLAFRRFGGGEFGTSGQSLDFPSTVEDIAPTVLEFLGLQGGNPLSASGRSLLPLLAGRETVSAAAPERVRFTETDLAVLPAPGGGVDEVATARQNSMFFEVDADTARLHLRPLFAPIALAYKERAAFTKDQLLAAMPAGPYEHQYLYVDFREHSARLLLERPGDDARDAKRLWDALAEHYKGELRKPVAVTREDWERHAREWETFIDVRKGDGSVDRTADGTG